MPKIPRSRRKSTATIEGASPLEKSWPPNWVVSFADLTTLLMTAFILWYSGKAMEVPSELLSIKKTALTEKEKEVFKQKGIADTASQIVSMIKKIAPQQELELLNELEKRKKLETELNDYVVSSGLADFINILSGIDGIIFTLRTDMLFPLGEAKLKPEAFEILDKVIGRITELLKNHPEYQLQIIGHTDTKSIDPFHRFRYHSNWELSYARALSVAKYFFSKGIPEGSVGVMGYGDTKPRFPNDTSENMTKNRRVEILINFAKPLI